MQRAADNPGRAALERLFMLAEQAIGWCERRGDGGLIPGRWFHLGHVQSERVGGEVLRLAKVAEAAYPIELRSPFEGTDSIAGGIWSGHELVARGREDGFAKLRFEAGTLDLPMHVHEHSDRFIVVLDGEGFFHQSGETLEGFTGREVSEIHVRPGDVLMFTRGLVHTFSAPDATLVLLSYHRPLIELDDPRQYTLPTVRWCARDARTLIRAGG